MMHYFLVKISKTKVDKHGLKDVAFYDKNNNWFEYNVEHNGEINYPIMFKRRFKKYLVNDYNNPAYRKGHDLHYVKVVDVLNNFEGWTDLVRT